MACPTPKSGAQLFRGHYTSAVVLSVAIATPLVLRQEIWDSPCRSERGGYARFATYRTSARHLDLLILQALALEPRHGWAISERVQQISSDVLRIQQGSLYPPHGRLAQTARHVQGGASPGELMDYKVMIYVGRLVGFEPTTFGTTIRRSTN